MTIRFGTDGWRGVLERDFTPEHVGDVIQAFCDRYPKLSSVGSPVVIGFDRRRMSREMAELAARICAGNGIETFLAQDYCPTPCVSWMVKRQKAVAGIMITASHNPPDWNGIKFKESYGGAASKEFLAPIEALIDANQAAGKKPKVGSVSGATSGVKIFDPHSDYIRAVGDLVDLKKIRKAGFKILFDALYGAGAGYLENLIGNQVTTLHGNADPDFGGIHPEPIIPYVNEAIATMRTGRYSVCLINDGDADRIGAIDEKGNYVTSHFIFALLLRHLVENQGRRGKVLKSISTTVMIDRLCSRYGLVCETTPIGFKYLSPAMKASGVLMGGEESGGIGMPHHICERDGIFCALLLLELMTVSGKTLGELVTDLQREVGPCHYKRVDLKFDPQTIASAKEKLENFEPTRLGGETFRKKTRIDGYHFAMEDESWLLIRPSGTEPLLRIYAEAPTPEQVELLLREASLLVAPRANAECSDA